jgi:hypothetical protein
VAGTKLAWFLDELLPQAVLSGYDRKILRLPAGE